MPVKISIVIVSYNSENFIEKCLKSIFKNLPSDREVVILDNASTDKTVQILEKFSKEIKLIKSSENLGFSRGNNKATKETKGEYLFFLNPDTEMEKPISELVQFYENAPNTGIVGPKLIMADGGIQPSVRKLPTILGAFKEYILGEKNAYSEYVPEGERPVEVEMVYGAAILIRRDLFEKLGGFDEKYFLYYEDADLCKRVRSIDKKVYYYPGVSIKHILGATDSDKDRYKLNYESSTKYHGLVGSFILQIIFFISRIINKSRS